MILPSQRTLLLLGLAVGLALGAPLGAAAQTSVESITVALWPEFDRPETLVIFRVTLPAEVPLPTTVRIPIPDDAAALTAVAYRDPADGLVNATYEREEGATADVVVVETASREIQVEYYDPLTIDGDGRTVAFTWPGGLPTGAFAFEVQQPIASDSFELIPPATSSSTDSLGLTYHQVDLGPLSGDEQPSVQATYRNPSGTLSAATLPPAEPLAAPSPSSGRVPSLTSVLPWLVLIGGIALIAAGLIYYFRVVRSSDTPARPRHRPARKPRAHGNEVDASPVFCHNCGAQATTSDRFCRMCGTALRT